MMTEEFRHYTVLLKETVDGLQVKPDGVYVDAHSVVPDIVNTY